MINYVMAIQAANEAQQAAIRATLRTLVPTIHRDGDQVFYTSADPDEVMAEVTTILKFPDPLQELERQAEDLGMFDNEKG